MEGEKRELQSAEEVLAEKRGRLVGAVDMMLDWQRSGKIKESIAPQIDNFTDAELDYLLEKVRNVDNQMQFRGPLASAASEFREASDNILTRLAASIDAGRIRELDQIFDIEK